MASIPGLSFATEGAANPIEGAIAPTPRVAPPPERADDAPDARARATAEAVNVSRADEDVISHPTLSTLGVEPCRRR